jgi:hypothetical protein
MTKKEINFMFLFFLPTRPMAAAQGNSLKICTVLEQIFWDENLFEYIL